MDNEITPSESTDLADRLMPTDSWEASPHFIRISVIAAILGSAFGLILLRLLEPEQTLRALGPTLLLLVGATGWVLNSRGRTQATLHVMVFGVWLTISGITMFTGGLQAPLVVAYPLFILLSGWLLGQRAALTVSALSVLVTLFMIYSSHAGTLPTMQHSVAAFHGAVHIMVYIIAAVLVTLLVNSFHNKMGELRALSQDLVTRTHDLEIGKAELQRAQAVAKVGSWVFDIRQDEIRLSEETCRIFGLPEGTVGTHDAYLSRVYLEDRDSVHSAWQAVFEGDGFDHEHRIQVGDTVRWVRQKAEVQFGTDGKAVRADGITQDISERKHSEHKIHSLAFFDHLTNLPNRTLLLDRLKQTMSSSDRTGIYSAVLLLDLDHFKTLNDTRGHDIGDKLLKQTAQRLSQCLREGDTVARFGGDEFVIVLSNLNSVHTVAATATELVAEKILKEIKRSYQLGRVEYHITASIGATLFRGKAIAIDDLLKQADLSMYKAKAAGRNRCCFFDPTLERAVNERAAMEHNLRKALANEEFELHYQLQVTADGALMGAEALLRWHLPAHGPVSPAEFIPLAEESGLMIPLGRWVLHSACSQLAAWAKQASMASVTLSVNVSAQQFNEPDFVAMVLGVLADTGASPGRLKLELTENLLVDNVQETIEKMTALKASGVSFSLDDFGTGYSSLSYLKQLPFDQLKIDQSFVRDILIDTNVAAIARTIVALAQSFGIGVIAEGVESKAQQDTLAEFGCLNYQGYYFGRPIPLEAFEQLIMTSYGKLNDS